ncbi:MAG: metallophosphoesterase [Bacteroidales bacterium]|jgi:hypothetical protein|nr:metallophosphoesterase [Bacteroidales bacterium]
MTPLIFILIVLLYLGASFYLAAKICRALKRRPRWVRITVWVVVLLLDFGYFTMRLLPDGCLTAKQVLYILSATWMAMVLYGSVVTLMLDIVRYFAMTHGQGKIYHTPRQMVVAGLATLLILGIGNINAKTPEVVHYEVDSDKLESGESLRIVLVSDLHLGFAIGKRDVEKLVSIINRQKPDVTLIAGDLIDGDIAPVVEWDLGRDIENIKSPMGVYAVLGNHEYIGDDQKAEAYLRSIGGLTVLRDEVVDTGRVRIIGRDDVTHRRKYGEERKALAEMMGNEEKLSIVIDHQPIAIDEVEKAGVDMMVSGHTHAGQVWPMRMFTSQIFEVDYGQACFGRSVAIVTSGFGTWGPRVRLGSDAEVVVITVKGKHK